MSNVGLLPHRDSAPWKGYFVIRSSVRAAAPALLLIVALSGCGPRSTPVAKVGDRTLTVEDFTRAARGNEAGVPGPPELAKAAMLRQLVERELFLVAAHQHGSDTLEATRRFAAGAERKLLLQALYQSLVPPGLAVSEGEARAMYDARREQADVNLIYTLDEAVVRLAAGRLAAGEPFDVVADQVNEPNALPPGGRLGLRSPGDLFQPLDDVMRTQPLHVVGGPWHTPQGWFLMKLNFRRPAPPAEFVQQRASLVELVRQRKQRQALSTALLALEQAHHLQVSPEGPAMLFRFLAPARAADAPHWMPDSAERATALATFDGGAYTMGDAMDALLNASDTRGPDASSLGSVRSWIQGQAVTELALLEARRRHLDQDQPVAGKVRDEVSNHLAEGEVLQAVASIPAPDPGAGHALWETLKAQYPQLRSMRLAWLSTADTAHVGALARHAAAGASLREAARAVDPALVVHEETVRFPAQEQPWSAMQAELSQVGPGGWSQPLFTGADWRLVQVLDREQGTVEWAQLTPPQQEQVTRSVGDRARQARFEAYKDSLWKAINPVLMPENLRRLAWPLPATLDVGP
jgi:hypothetical protein